MGTSDEPIGVGEILGSGRVVNKELVDLARLKPRGEHAATPTADLLFFTGPFLFWDSSMRRGTRGGSGGGLSKIYVNITLIFFHLYK